MNTKLHLDRAAEKEATDIGAKFMHSSDVVGDMSRAYGRDLSSVRIHTDESAARGAAERGVDAFSTGKDVFFARGAFDRSDPASRGLLAHELSHSMQQGVGGGAPALTQSAPMGAAQGGLREWFNRLFGKSGNGAEPAPEQEPAANEVAPEPGPAAPAQDTPETDTQPELTQNNDPQKELDDAAEALRTSKKWGLLGNSDKFENVSAAIHTSVGKLNTTLSGDLAQDQDILGEISDSFRELINACDDYITSHDPSTDRGKHRQDIVRQVRELAAKDLAGFAIYMSSPDKDEHVTNAIDILKKSRQRTLQLVDKNEEELEHVGGAASYIAKIEPGMLTDENASGFFKEDEVYTKYDRATIKNKFLDILERVRQKITMSDEQYEAIKAAIIENNGIASPEQHVPGYNNDRTIHEAVALITHLSKANETTEGYIHNPLEVGQSFNLSKRNVATSRLAELLGLGDLVAKSETATLVDADGTSRSGNLMQAAKGQEVTDFVVDQYRDQYASERSKKTSGADVHLNVNLDDKVTPEFLKSLMALQVLDNLAAQGDRHSANYFAEIKDGKLGKVQAIDNDFSFSTETLDWGGKSGRNMMGTHGRYILDRNGDLDIPYMDRALADRILAVDEQVLRDVMADVLEPWAIDALCTRFQQVKDAIQKDQEKNPGRYLEHDEDWGRKEVFDALRNGSEMRAGGMKNPTNYVSNLLMSADMADTKHYATMRFETRLEEDYMSRLCSEVLLEIQNTGDEENAKEILRAYAVKDHIISYLETTGQLLDGPALLKRLPEEELKGPIKDVIRKRLYEQNHSK